LIVCQSPLFYFLDFIHWERLVKISLFRANHPDYVKITCGSLENLPAAFAELDRAEVKKVSTLQRSNKDTELMKYICAMIADKKTMNQRICN